MAPGRICEVTYFSVRLVVALVFVQLLQPVGTQNSTMSAISMNPTTSSISTNPTTSSISTNPTTPAISTNPRTSSILTNPTTSSISTNPTKSTISTNLTTSAISTKPTTSTISTNPTTSTISTNPTTSVISTNPSTSSISTNPTTPAILNNPTTPAISTNLTTSSISTVPATSALPTQMSATSSMTTMSTPTENPVPTEQPVTTVTDSATEPVTEAETRTMTNVMNETGATGPTLDPRPCIPDPCQGNGDCILENSAAGYRCSCHVGFAGYACEINLNPCLSDPCDDVEMTCISDYYNQYRCVPWHEVNGTNPLILTTTVSPDTWLTGSTIGIIVAICVAIPLFCLWILLIIWWTTWRKLHADDERKYTVKYAEEAANKYNNREYKMGNAKSWLVPDSRSSMRAHKMRDRWLIHESQLDLGKLIYSGEFAYICEGMYKSKERDTPEKVVVKLLRDEKDEESLNELKNEFEVLACMGRHPNVVWLQGLCTRTLEESTQTCLINEYVARGDMLRILRRGRCRRRDQPPFSPTPVDELMSFACDIAQGMRHVTLLRYVHRNLCAKNVLITFNNKAKIGDFSLATELPASTEYVPSVEHRNKHIKRWMAYEALLEDMHSIKSDVWSFGIVLWEIVTLGGMPYFNIKTPDLLGELRDHNRMEWPNHCSPEFYDLMLRCWHRRPESRPSFDMLCTELKKMKPMAKKHLNLKGYTYQLYVPVKLEEDVIDTTQDSTFV